MIPKSGYRFSEKIMLKRQISFSETGSARGNEGRADRPDLFVAGTG
jgi:hypothetical protein